MTKIIAIFGELNSRFTVIHNDVLTSHSVGKTKPLAASLHGTASISIWINTEYARGKLQDLRRNSPLYRQRIKILRFSDNHFLVCVVSKPRKSHYQTHT